MRLTGVFHLPNFASEKRCNSLVINPPGRVPELVETGRYGGLLSTSYFLKIYFYPHHFLIKTMKITFAPLVRVSTGLMALLMIIIISCKGPEGPTGPQGTTGPTGTGGPTGPQGVSGTTGATGPQGTSGVAGPAGPQGVAGTTGAQGPMGNANVVYTAWKPVDLSTNFYAYPENKVVYLGNDLKTANAVLTQDAIDKGLIYIYYKTRQKEFDSANNETKLVERILTTNGTGWVKIPGRTTNRDEDFTNYYIGNEIFGVNYLKFSGFVYTNRNDVVTPDIAAKSAQFYRDMLKDMPQYRIIVAYGSTPGGRMGSVDFGNYAAVKKAYNLPD